MSSYWVYMLRCHDGSYYVGYTHDLAARLWEHEQGLGCDWTRRRRPVDLVWCEDVPTKSEALSAERRMKGWSVKKKLALIDRDWDRISRLARSYQIRNQPVLSEVEGRMSNPTAGTGPSAQAPLDPSTSLRTDKLGTAHDEGCRT